MNHVTTYSGTELHSSVPNFFLYRRLKKNRIYKMLLLSSVLHTLLFTYYKLVHTRDLIMQKWNFRILGTSYSVFKRLYLTRLNKLSDKQHLFVLDTIATRLKMHHFLNPYISGDKWNSFLQFLITPDALENRLLDLDSERLTASSLELDSLLNVSQHITGPIKRNWSYETLSMFFNFKFNFDTKHSTLKNTQKLLGLGSDSNYRSISTLLYKKLDVFLETSEIVSQNIKNLFINGSHTTVRTFLLRVGDILSYRTSVGHSDVSVVQYTPVFNRRFFVSLHTLISLNPIYTWTTWLKLRTFFFKLINLPNSIDNYFFYGNICFQLISVSSNFMKTAFSTTTTHLYRSTIRSTHATIDSVLIFSNSVIQSRFFTIRVLYRYNSETIYSPQLLDMYSLIVSIVQNFFNIMNISVLNTSELLNWIIFFNRWLSFNSGSSIRTSEYLFAILYSYYVEHSAKRSLKSTRSLYGLLKQAFMSRLVSSVTTYFSVRSLFLRYYSDQKYFIIGMENLRSLQWSFFLNLKYSTIIAFNYIRWRHSDLEYLLFYDVNDSNIDLMDWFYNHDKIGTVSRYNSILKYS